MSCQVEKRHLLFREEIKLLKNSEKKTVLLYVPTLFLKSQSLIHEYFLSLCVGNIDLMQLNYICFRILNVHLTEKCVGFLEFLNKCRVKALFNALVCPSMSLRFSFTA